MVMGSRTTRPGIALAAPLACAVFALVPGHAGAAPWMVDPLFDARAGFESNPRMRDTGGDDTWQLSSSIGARVEQDTGFRRLEFQGEVGYTTYSGDDEALEDGDFQALQARTAWEREATTWRLDGTARRDNTILSVFDVQALEDFPDDIDQGADIDARSVDETVTRHRIFVEPSVEHALSERWEAGASYRGGYIGFERGGTENVGSLNHEFELRLGVDVTQRLETGVVVQGALFRPRGNQQAFNTYGAAVDLEYRLTERTWLTGLVGARQSDPYGNDNDAESGTGLIGGVGVRHQAEPWRFRADLERRLLPNSRGFLTETDQVRLTVGRELSPHWDFVTTARAFTSRGISNRFPPGANDEFLSVQPRMSYRLSEDWSLTADYRYEALRRVGSDRTAEGHGAFLGIEYSPRRRY